jgi:hypothetical protein
MQCFEFTRKEYATDFMVANPSKLINVTHERRALLDDALDAQRGKMQAAADARLAELEREKERIRAVTAAKIAEIDATSNAKVAELRAAAEARAAESQLRLENALAQQRASMEDELYVALVDRIERAKGPAARRAILEAGLRQLSRVDLLANLRVEAARIEGRAALEKADSLSSPAAKLRTLRSAIDAIAAEPIPEAIRADEVRTLEAAIREVERNG